MTSILSCVSAHLVWCARRTQIITGLGNAHRVYGFFPHFPEGYDNYNATKERTNVNHEETHREPTQLHRTWRNFFSGEKEIDVFDFRFRALLHVFEVGKTKHKKQHWEYVLGLNFLATRCCVWLKHKFGTPQVIISVNDCKSSENVNCRRIIVPNWSHFRWPPNRCAAA